MVSLGFVAGLVVPAVYVEAGIWPLARAASFLATISADMALFSGFFAAAIAYRRRPEIHKRLMLLAAIALILPGVARLWFIEAMFAGGVSAGDDTRPAPLRRTPIEHSCGTALRTERLGSAHGPLSGSGPKAWVDGVTSG